jgi:hypothetical protein
LASAWSFKASLRSFLASAGFAFSSSFARRRFWIAELAFSIDPSDFN